MNTQNTSDLLARAAAGDEKARALLLQRVGPNLAGLAYMKIPRRWRSKLDPEDLVQEVFLRAVQAKDGWPQAGSKAVFIRWIETIMDNVIRDKADHFESGKADLRREQPIDAEGGGPGLDLASPERGPKTAAEQREDWERIHTCLARLPSKYRKVIELKRLYGMTWKEIGDELNLTPGAAHQLEIRASAAFASCWARLFGKEPPTGSGR